MCAQIVFPRSTAPGNDKTESAGRLINCYAETLPEGGPAPYVIRRAPDLTVFSETSETGFRGIWYDGASYVYVAWEGELFYINAAGTETSVGALIGSRVTFLDSIVDTSNLTIYTYAAVALGTAHFNRRIVVAVTYDAANDAPATVTVGGVAATSVVASGTAIELFIALVPTGTTGDIVVTYATAALRSSIGVWRIDGADSSTAHDTISGSATSPPTPWAGDLTLAGTAGGIIVGSVKGLTTGTLVAAPITTEDFEESVESSYFHFGVSDELATTTLYGLYGSGMLDLSYVAATWEGASPGGTDIVTFAKNNKAPTADQVLVTPTLGAFTFTTSAITVLDVNSTVPNSVCFGEGYFFFTVPDGYCYASGLNATTVSSLDRARAEARAEALVRGVFWAGELYLFGLTHTEVWASGGNPNATGFPLNRTTTIWSGLIAPLAVCGFEEGFEGGLFWVADDNSVRTLDGYSPVTISPPDLERQIEACTDKANIRAWVYDVAGHASVVFDLAGENTWVFDLGEATWHERQSLDSDHDHWVATGNSVRAFGKWLVGHHHNGNIYEVDGDNWNATPIVESIAMESFPDRIAVGKQEFNFVSGVGNATVPNPKVLISWSDDGGHRWKNPKVRKLGEAGKFKQHVRVNRGGLTGSKGRRYRIRCNDESVYFALLNGSMDVAGRPTGGGK